MPGERVSTFEQDDAQMVYTESGVETGDAFVLVHGIGMGHRVFRDLAEELGKAGRVYAVDLPGFGDSPEPGSAHSMQVSGDFLAAFVLSLPVLKPVLVGHSMGTEVVTEAVVRHPEISDRIVLIAPTVNIHERRALLQGWRMIQDLAGESPKVFVLGMIQYAKTGPLWFIRKLRIMLDHEVELSYPKVQASALVLRGATDRVCPAEWVEQVAELIPRSIMREIPDRGHEAMISAAQPVASMILEHAAANG
jgi:pimeloyl-ACP methyl ester carboxylesterase